MRQQSKVNAQCLGFIKGSEAVSWLAAHEPVWPSEKTLVPRLVLRVAVRSQQVRRGILASDVCLWRIACNF